MRQKAVKKMRHARNREEYHQRMSERHTWSWRYRHTEGRGARRESEGLSPSLHVQNRQLTRRIERCCKRSHRTYATPCAAARCLHLRPFRPVDRFARRWDEALDLPHRGARRRWGVGSLQGREGEDVARSSQHAQQSDRATRHGSTPGAPVSSARRTAAGCRRC